MAQNSPSGLASDPFRPPPLPEHLESLEPRARLALYPQKLWGVGPVATFTPNLRQHDHLSSAQHPGETPSFFPSLWTHASFPLLWEAVWPLLPTGSPSTVPGPLGPTPAMCTAH